MRLGFWLLEGKPENALASDCTVSEVRQSDDTATINVLIGGLLSSVRQLESYLLLVAWLTLGLAICARKSFG